MESKLRDIVLNAREPVVLKNLKIPWKCFDLTLDEWCAKFDHHSNGKNLNFETAKLKHSASPQWEKYRTQLSMTCSEFARNSADGGSDFFRENWAGLTYRNISEMPSECREGIDFKSFGFDQSEADCTFWLSSKGAHTPCHYDTYGCNIVVQVYGRKQWLLFPNGTPLSPIRVPYEESSVYCAENFYSPQSSSQFSKIFNGCHRVVLYPGDVLIVPRHWWHYVENLETSLSVNSWIPLNVDCDSQLEEAIVNYLIQHFVQSKPLDEMAKILNPNEKSSFFHLSSDEGMLRIMEYLSQQSLDGAKVQPNSHPYQYLPDESFRALIKSVEPPVCIEWVRKCSEHEFEALLKENAKRFEEDKEQENATGLDLTREILINSICSPDVVRHIRMLFLEKYEKQRAS